MATLPDLPKGFDDIDSMLDNVESASLEEIAARKGDDRDDAPSTDPSPVPTPPAPPAPAPIATPPAPPAGGNQVSKWDKPVTAAAEAAEFVTKWTAAKKDEDEQRWLISVLDSDKDRAHIIGKLPHEIVLQVEAARTKLGLPAPAGTAPGTSPNGTPPPAFFPGKPAGEGFVWYPTDRSVDPTTVDKNDASKWGHMEVTLWTSRFKAVYERALNGRFTPPGEGPVASSNRIRHWLHSALHGD